MNIRSINNWRLLAGLVILSGAAVNAATAGTAEQDVIAAENQEAKAVQANNVELYGSFLADKYVQTDQDGTVLVGKAAALADEKAYTISSEELSDLKVTVYGDTAIATGTYVAKGTYKSKPFDNRGRFTDTWVKLDGKWQLVADHYSIIKK
jgi:ketosteroid isomerase-like protein